MFVTVKRMAKTEILTIINTDNISFVQPLEEDTCEIHMMDGSVFIVDGSIYHYEKLFNV